MRLRKKFEVVVFSLVVVFSFVLFLGSQFHWDLEEEMKPYLFLSGLLLGTNISMSSLMADTHVVNASCNDARTAPVQASKQRLPRTKLCQKISKTISSTSAT